MNKTTLKKISRRLAAAVLALVCLLSFQAAVHAEIAQAKGSGGDFTTSSFKVKINVNKDNTAFVNETITIDAKKPVSGIERTIPLYSAVTYTDQSGKELKTVRHPVKVENVSVENDSYSVKKTPWTAEISIGSDKNKVKGKKTYNLSYEIENYDDSVDEEDLFSMMVFPASWPVSADGVKITVNMPKRFDKNSVKTNLVKEGRQENAKDLSVSIKGKTLTVESEKSLPEGTGIMAEITLPEGYFSGENSVFLSRIMIIAADILIAVLLLVLWFVFGRDRKNVTTVEGIPPEAVTPPEAGYILDGETGPRDLVSMVIWFCDRGYMKVEEEGKSWRIVKVKPLPDDEAKDYQKTFFNGLFDAGDGESVLVSELAGKECVFADTAKKQLTEYFTENRKRRIFPGKATLQRIGAFAVSAAGFFVILLGIRNISGDMISMISVPLSAVLLYFGVLFGFSEKAGRKIAGIILSAASAVLLVFILIARLDFLLGGLSSILFIAAAWASMRFMGGRTKYGRTILGKLLGFREFIRAADPGRLEEITKENPYYYSNVLPYAYVLGSSKKWSKKFESIQIPMPDWYVSDAVSEENFDSWTFFRHLAGFTKSLVLVFTETKAGEKLSAFGGLSGRRKDSK